MGDKIDAFKGFGIILLYIAFIVGGIWSTVVGIMYFVNKNDPYSNDDVVEGYNYLPASGRRRGRGGYRGRGRGGRRGGYGGYWGGFYRRPWMPWYWRTYYYPNAWRYVAYPSTSAYNLYGTPGLQTYYL